MRKSPIHRQLLLCLLLLALAACGGNPTLVPHSQFPPCGSSAAPSQPSLASAPLSIYLLHS
jgi:hypothetical protein